MACGLTHIRRGTASTLRQFYTGKKKTFVWKNRKQTWYRDEGIEAAIDLDAESKRMCPCEWKAEIHYFLGNRLDRRFGMEGIVEESTNNPFKHVRRETIEFK